MAIRHDGSRSNDLHLTCKAISTIALLTALLYLYASLDGRLSFAGLGNVTADSRLLFGLMAAGAIGLLLAWRFERAGGAVALLSGALLAVLVYATGTANPLVGALVYSSPFIIGGLLSVVAGSRNG
jgi:hypothetical protein